ncbi:MAG: RNA 2',3'-cyclic phosphodiesterase [Candidatus Sericytochromatia bacterium]|nr:RNA 2',3'-cyclic phosphodiesterase [Candidatus Sericytochromatia bacterium]
MAASPADQARLFVGITVPEALHAELLAIRAATDAPWRWTAPERLHVTLRFLGNLPRAAMGDIAAALAPVSNHPPLSLQVGGFLGFPEPHAARILTRGVSVSDALQALHDSTSAALRPWSAASAGETFRPHITLARSKAGLPIPETAVLPLDWMATHVHLIESRLQPQGPDYRIVASVSLGADRWVHHGSSSG